MTKRVDWRDALQKLAQAERSEASDREPEADTKKVISASSEVENGSALRADVCIIGSGPAGVSIALALRMADHLKKVLA